MVTPPKWPRSCRVGDTVGALRRTYVMVADLVVLLAAAVLLVVWLAFPTDPKMLPCEPGIPCM